MSWEAGMYGRVGSDGEGGRAPDGKGSAGGTTLAPTGSSEPVSHARQAMLLFILSESVFFLLLILAYADYHRKHGQGPTARESLDIVKSGIFSLCLWSSSATMWAAMAGLRRRSGRRLAAGLLGSIILGTTFLVGQGTEYAGLLRRDVTISRNLFGTTFFTLTGFHGIHVAVGLIMMGVLLVASRFGRRADLRVGALEGVSIYWHFVDAVWIFIFGIVYVWAYL